MFVDSTTLKVQAGKGGDGLLSWRREKFIAMGGPDGGDGGKGGDVIFIADHNLNTLAHLRHTPQIKAEAGQPGGHQRQHGKNGADISVQVPVGTVVWDDGAVLADLTRKNQQVVVAAGGRGGFGNAHFISSTRRAPELSELGEPGETKELQIELKLIADVGLVGLPNAGKSTLLSVISNAKPEIADYPFTTTAPNLGVAQVDDDSFLVADIPGLIEGASKGKGLGDEFLRHIERTAVILHLIDGVSEDVAADYKTVNQELKDYPVNLSRRPRIVVLTKVEAISAAELKAKKVALAKLTKAPVVAISAVAHRGLDELLRATVKLIKQARRKPATKAKAGPVVLTIADDPNAWWIEKKEGKFIVRGQKIEAFGRRTNFKQADGLRRLRDIMEKFGVSRELARLGARVGDTVSIAGKDLKL